LPSGTFRKTVSISQRIIQPARRVLEHRHQEGGPAVRVSMNARFFFKWGASELLADPVSEFSNSQ